MKQRLLLPFLAVVLTTTFASGATAESQPPTPAPNSTPEAAAPTDPLTALSFNMAGGWVCTVHTPDPDDNDDPCKEGLGTDDPPPYDADRTKSPTALANTINDKGPDLVLLQEACRDWTNQVAAETGYTAEFQAATEGDGSEKECKTADDDDSPQDHDFGVAVLVEPGLGAPEFTEYNLGDENDGEYRWMLCADFAARNMTACTAHTKELSTTQTEKVADVLAQSYPGRSKILGGDFNAPNPKQGGGAEEQMKYLYHPAYTDGDSKARPTSAGAYQEVFSPCGETLAPTTDDGVPCKWYEEGVHHSRPSKHITWLDKQKIDYLFVSQWVTVSSRSVTDASYSDHRMLWATLDVPEARRRHPRLHDGQSDRIPLAVRGRRQRNPQRRYTDGLLPPVGTAARGGTDQPLVVADRPGRGVALATPVGLGFRSRTP